MVRREGTVFDAAWLAEAYRQHPGSANLDYLASPLAKWRYDELMRRFENLEQISKEHAESAAYWHRQTERARMVEVERTRYIEVLESERVRR